jgi:hypothetical protein
MGDRTVEADGSIQFEDLTNNRKAVIMFSTYKKSGFWNKKESGQKDHFTGLIYDCKPIVNHALSAKLLFSKNAEEIKDLKQLKDIVKPICEIEGSYLKAIFIDDKKYWDIDEDYPER